MNEIHVISPYKYHGTWVIVHRVELPPLVIAQRLIKPLKRRAEDLYGFNGE
jgi:hypothetical protein